MKDRQHVIHWAIVAAALLISLPASLVVLAVQDSTYLDRIDLGDVPTWVSALGGMGALVAAGIAAWYARKVYEVETARDLRYDEERREREREARMAQAVKVSAWWLPPSKGRIGVEPGHVGYALIRNASDLPARQVTINFSGKYLDDKFYSWFHTEHIDTVPPGDKPQRVYLPDSLTHPPNDNDYQVEIFFTDAAGRRYRRDNWGILHEMKPSEYEGKPLEQGGLPED